MIKLTESITWIRNFSQRKEFPEKNSVRPHVRLAGKDAIRQGFNRHPLDRHQSLEIQQNNVAG